MLWNWALVKVFVEALQQTAYAEISEIFDIDDEMTTMQKTFLLSRFFLFYFQAFSADVFQITCPKMSVKGGIEHHIYPKQI